MKNQTLHHDYITRAENRVAALEVLFERSSWPDVVREAQEIVELALKALLRSAGIEVPRIHDVGDILLAAAQSFPKISKKDLEKMAEISSSLRRDRELSFYGSEDLTPSEFYKKKHAEEARKSAQWLVQNVRKVIQSRPMP